MNMMLVKSTDFNGIPFECYKDSAQDNSSDFWATRTQIGLLLGYADPEDAIKKIHLRNKERIDKFSRGDKMSRVEGERVVTREVTVYNFRGLLEICRYSQQPVANNVMDFLYDIADEIRRAGFYAMHDSVRTSTRDAVDAAIRILETQNVKGNQLTLTLDKVYRRCTGFSLLETAGIQLTAPTQHQLLTPTDIGKHFGISARRVNELLAGAGYQYNLAGKWEALELGTPYAVVQDTNKRHSDGTPVRQLKWDAGILPIIEQLLDVPA